MRKQTYFSEIVEYLGKHWKFSFSNGTGEELFNEFVRDCHPFVFVPTGPGITPHSGKIKAMLDVLEDNSPGERRLGFIEPVLEPQDLPYPLICVEVLGQYITVPQGDEDMKIWINAFIAREIAPKEYEFLIFTEFSPTCSDPLCIGNHDHPRRQSIAKITRKDEGNFSTFNGLLKVYLDRLSKEKMGIAARESKVKIGTGKNKEFYRPKNVTIVSPKNKMTEAEESGNFRDVVWTHRWEVRGHWREVKGLGKDREGNYCIPGFTWVMNHVKGPDSAPIIKKTYLVEG